MVHKFYIGIDISLKKFDVSLFCEDKKSPHAVFENTHEGFTSFLRWCKKHAGVPKKLHIVMESTNVYWEDLAHFCQQKGATVSVVNPRLIKGYAKAVGLRGKTDKLDAALIARYAAKEQPEAWKAPPPLFRKLLLRVRQNEHMKTLLAAERTRSKMLRDGDALASNARHIAFLKDEIKELTREIEDFINKNSELNKGAQLLASIPMLGKASLPWVLACLQDGKRFTSARAAAGYAGLTPMLMQSGERSDKPHISRMGPADLRKALYMPAVVYSYGKCRESVYLPFVQRLEANGKAKKVIIVALMRKVLTIAQAVLASGKPFDPVMLGGGAKMT